MRIGLVGIVCLCVPIGCSDRHSDDVGDHSTAVPAWFEEEAAKRGIVFEHQAREGNSAERRILFPEIMGSGAALADFNGDGWLDAYLVQGGDLVEPGVARNALFVNDGTGLFTNESVASGTDDAGYGMGVAVGDYDNDGDVDIYVTNVGPNVLLRNDGTGSFEDMTDAAGVGDEGWGTSAAFLDYDRDGDLDLFCCNYVQWSVRTDIQCYDQAGRPDFCSPNSYNAPQADVLFRNEGDGTFTDVSIEAGLRATFGNGLGVVCGDFDGDGWIDIYVANDQMPNQLWRNNGDGTFVDIGPRTGSAVDQHGEAKAGMGVTAGDLDEDGDLDVMVVNLQAQSDSFFRNEGAWFSDGAAAVGVGGATRPFTRFGMGWADFNLDGWQDYYVVNGRVTNPPNPPDDGTDPFAEPNVLMRGVSAGRFEIYPLAGGVNKAVVATSRGAAFGDVDNNGRIDVLVNNCGGPAHLLMNKSPGEGRWISFRALNDSGCDAIGATITCRLGDRTIRRDVRSAYSYCSANDLRVHIGLGDSARVDAVTVNWNDGGETSSFGARQAGSVHVLQRSPRSP